MHSNSSLTTAGSTIGIDRPPSRPTSIRRALVGAGLASVLTISGLGLGSVPVDAAGYPYPHAPDCDEFGSDDGCVPDEWNFYQGQCTSWVAWKLNAVNGVGFHNWYQGVRWGNASNWDDAARRVNIPVDGRPGLGAVAQWDGRNHVAYVEKVNGDGSIVISEMNYDLHNGVRTNQTLRPGQSGWPDRFIHIKDRDQTPTTTPPATSYKGKIVRNRNSGAAYLVRNDGKRYWIPNMNHYTPMVNNGLKVVNLSPSAIDKIPSGSGRATVQRVDEPTISGPSKWMTKRRNTRHGFGRDYWITQSAAGKNHTTNSATWNLTVRADGVYRVRVFVPHREAVASATYEIFDGPNHVKTVEVAQKNRYGWTSLGDHRFRTGNIRIVQADNRGRGPYGAMIGWDAADAIPLR